MRRADRQLFSVKTMTVTSLTPYTDAMNADNNDRINRVRERLELALEPETLEITDDSHKHAGHPGARTGMSHFSVLIRAECFRDCPPLQRHRVVFEALGDMMRTDIHALRIDAAPPEPQTRAGRDQS